MSSLFCGMAADFHGTDGSRPAVSLPLNEAPWRKPRGTTETIQLSSRPALTDLPPALIPKDQTKTGLTLVFPELRLCAVGRFVINIIGTFFSKYNLQLS